jgi:hypothetical protein
VVSIGSSSPRELFTVVAVTGIAIALVVAPVLVYTAETTVVVDGVSESSVFTGVDDDVDRSLLGQPSVTVNVTAGRVARVTATTRTGTALDSVRVAPTQTSVRIGCEPGRTCVVRAHATDGTTVDTITVTLVREGPL